MKDTAGTGKAQKELTLTELEEKLSFYRGQADKLYRIGLFSGQRYFNEQADAVQKQIEERLKEAEHGE